MMIFGPTADPDNAEISPVFFNRFLEAMDTRIYWRAPDQAETGRFQSDRQFADKGDRIFAATDEWKNGAWVLQNDWNGFPDPAEYLFLGFDAFGGVNAAGYFEDWPGYWHRSEQKEGPQRGRME